MNRKTLDRLRLRVAEITLAHAQAAKEADEAYQRWESLRDARDDLQRDLSIATERLEIIEMGAARRQQLLVFGSPPKGLAAKWWEVRQYIYRSSPQAAYRWSAKAQRVRQLVAIVLEEENAQ